MQEVGQSRLGRRGIVALTLFLWLALGGLHPLESQADSNWDEEAGKRINFRVGAASTDSVRRPTLCLEAMAIADLSVEGCGTGSGFLHQEPGKEMAHFRAKWVAYRRPLGSGVLRLQPGVGFAELEIDIDDSGFSFTDVSSKGTSTAGPEVSASATWLTPIGGRFAFIANATTGFAYFRHAPKLRESQRAEQLFASFEIGIGF